MKTLMTLLLSASLFAIGCGDDDGGGSADAMNQADAADQTPDATVTPQMPALGTTQIDRAGRPAISTALQATFDGNETSRNASKDAYNADASQSTWGASYTGAAPAAPGTGAVGSGFIGSLAILDSLNATCGDQLIFDPDTGTGTGYTGLAGVLADDRLYVNSEPTVGAGVTCAVGYLAVEANATAVVPNDDCGGRTLINDVIDRSYSVLAVGALSGVSDGVDANDVAFRTTFPYLAVAH